MSNFKHEEHEDFIKEYKEAIQPVLDKHKKQLVAAFRFGNEWRSAELIVQDISEETKEEE